jgi:peptide-methionine (S)-S-oxide reductase
MIKKQLNKPKRRVPKTVLLPDLDQAESARFEQDYAYYDPNNPYIQVCDRPKIDALKQQFPYLFVEYKLKK